MVCLKVSVHLQDQRAVRVAMERATILLTVLGSLLLCVSSLPAKKGRDVDIYSFHINSTVNSRYAVTVITSRVANRLNESKEVHFQVKIPKNAFISKFRMTIEGKTYDGVVKKKEEAQQQYSQAVSRGESAGIVSSVGRTLEEFKTSVTVSAFSKVTFELTYEELLKRRLGKYELRIHAQPMQTVADFKIDVYINEHPGISYLEVKGGLKTQELSSAVISTLAASTNEAWVNFYPTREQQTKCEGCGKNGLNGDLLVEYDVKRPKQNGELKALNGYFVHYFAPTDLLQIPKNVVFLIDKSGSMRGKKIQQTHLAMLEILGDLAGDDYFGLITFDSSVHIWKPELLRATEANVQAAKSFVKEIKASGGTNINQAMLDGVEMIQNHPRQGSASILILLTDGDPTSGVTNTARIQENIKAAIGGKFPLYCLGFGFDVNFDFLEKMALENDGVARRIYEDSDADLQLQGFYEEVATPLLTDLQLNYIGAANLTQTSFRQYYNGSEIVVSGKITDNSLETLQTEVIAISKSASVKYQDSVSTKDLIDVSPQHENFTQRLWAYLTVKQLLEKEVTLKGDEKDAARKKALDLSLRYEFVTSLTSMVVTKPQEQETQVAHKPKEGAELIKKAHNRRVTGHSARRPAGSRDMTVVSDPLYHLQPSLLRPDPRLRTHMYGKSGARLDTRPRTGVLSGIQHDIFPTMVYRLQKTPAALVPAATSVRFVMSAQPKPICYNTPVGHKLRLLLDTSSDFSMNGELSENGFQEIAIHHKTATLLVSPTESVYSDGEMNVKLIWGQSQANSLELDSVSIFLRDNELDVGVGNVRVVLILHKKRGEVFLWPSIRQQPKNATRGVLGKTDLQYAELPGSKLKIVDQEVLAQLSSAIDYRFPAAPTVECWLVPFQSALQGELSDFTVSQL
ncbi:inter-alpha-trypsin inhibitor heavy chain H3 isoform X3 [Ictalurus punctatus]|uniref:Inter-alpha-trypsin inhibitor heavy chain H3 isoform X3 n=1 Tax=Ictalurus punctatus TaxID=7998 RepID=A0A2D0PI61_ICTPU|nr:inter-alpha-trypsin inhibitor heavy chain H3 isoform X3 [Ictalurus punctatus]